MEKERSVEDWQLAKKRISERLQHLLESQQWSDCKFIVQSDDNRKVLNAHKLVLAISSPVFEAMFFGGMAEQKKEIIISDVQPNAFQAVLEYIYSDKLNITTFDEACEVCYAAKKYMLPDLVEQCTQKIFQHLTAGNACKAYEFAKLIDQPALKDRSLQIIEQETETVLADSSFQSVQLATLLMILDLKFLNIPSEILIFNAVLGWATKECDRKGLPAKATNLRRVVGPALEKIRFLSLTPKQFADSPARSPLLTKHEAYTILLEIVNPSKARSELPRHFSTVMECRNRSERDIHKDCQKYCLLKINQPYYSYGYSSLTLPCRFSMDRGALILGFKIATWHMDQRKGCLKPIGVSIEDLDGRCVSETLFSFQMSDKKEQDLYFDRPAVIEKVKVYAIRLKILQPNKEQMWKMEEKVMRCEKVTFNPFDTQDNSTRICVKAIIISH